MPSNLRILSGVSVFGRHIGFKRELIFLFRIALITLFFQLLFQSAKGRSQKEDPDSIGVLLSKSSSVAEKFQLTKKLIDVYAASDAIKTTTLFDSLMVLSNRAGILLSSSYYEWAGTYCRKAGDYKLARKYYQQAVTIYYKEKNGKKLADCLSWLGYLMYVMNDYSAGFKICFTNLKLIEETGYQESLALTYIDLGFLMRGVNNYDESISFFKLAGEAAAEVKDTLCLFTAYNEIGNDFFYKGNYQMALKFQKQSLDLKSSNPTKYSGTLGYSYNDIASTHIHMKKYEQAIDYLQKAIKTGTAKEDNRYFATTYYNLGGCYKEKGDYQKALKYLTIALEFSSKSGNRYNFLEIYKSLSDVYSITGNYMKAYNFLTLSIVYKDSLFNLESQKQINELKTVYETEKKEKEILLLNKEKEKQAEKEKKQRIIILSVIIGLLFVSGFAVFAHRQKVKIKKEKKRSDELLLNILPSETAEELKHTGFAEPKQFDMATVMFTDFKGFTGIAEKMSAKELVAELHYCFKNFDEIISRYPIEKIKTIGDSYMCAGGLPSPNITNPVDVVNAALDIRTFMEQYKQQKISEGKLFFEVRIGVHTGVIVAGIVGTKKFSYDIWGDTVNVASRMESSGEPGKINISEATYEHVKDGFNCVYRGEIEAKGKGKTKMYFIEGI